MMNQESFPGVQNIRDMVKEGAAARRCSSPELYDVCSAARKAESVCSGDACYLSIRPDMEPPAIFRTSLTDTRLKSPSMVCLSAEAAAANSMAD